MRILFLDLASHLGSVACVTETAVARFAPVDHRVDDASLHALLEATIKEAGWTWKDFTHLACVTGPGGFTSLRVATAAISGFAYGLGIPAAGVPLWDITAARAGDGKYHWLHSTKKTLVFHRSPGSAAEPQCIPVAELPAALQAGEAWAGELIPEHRARVEALGLREQTLRPVENVLPSVLAALPYGSDTVLPWYGRGW